MRPKGPRENSPGVSPGVFITETSSPEGAAQNPCATWLLCRPFRALLFCRPTPGSRPGLISGRPFGARQRLEGRISRQKLVLKAAQFFARMDETDLECASLLIVIGTEIFLLQPRGAHSR